MNKIVINGHSSPETIAKAIAETVGDSGGYGGEIQGTIAMLNNCREALGKIVQFLHENKSLTDANVQELLSYDRHLVTPESLTEPRT